MASREQLAIYLNDHLAGSTAARDLIQRGACEAEDTPLGTFLGSLLRDIEADRSELRSIMERLDVEEQALKQAAGSLLEKVSRLKFGVFDRDGASVNRVLELESLLIGIEGKAALWRTLNLISASEPRLAGIDFNHLAERAKQQQEAVERHRQELVCTAFT